MDTNDLRERAIEVADQWHIFSWLHFRCQAISDGGIDTSEDKEYHRFSIRPEDVLFNGNGAAVGVRFGEFTFYFDDPKKRKFSVVEKDEYVGGWGDITETRYYRLEKGPRD